jgi:hypothetical protein
MSCISLSLSLSLSSFYISSFIFLFPISLSLFSLSLRLVDCTLFNVLLTSEIREKLSFRRGIAIRRGSKRTVNQLRRIKGPKNSLFIHLAPFKKLSFIIAGDELQIKTYAYIYVALAAFFSDGSFSCLHLSGPPFLR